MTEQMKFDTPETPEERMRRETNEALKRTASEKLRDEGIQRVTSKNGLWLTLMRKEARRLARIRGCVTADSLRPFADSIDLKPTHHNAWGGIFRGAEWKPIGYINSTKLENHARKIVEWRIDG